MVEFHVDPVALQLVVVVADEFPQVEDLGALHEGSHVEETAQIGFLLVESDAMTAHGQDAGRFHARWAAAHYRHFLGLRRRRELLLAAAPDGRVHLTAQSLVLHHPGLAGDAPCARPHLRFAAGGELLGILLVGQ